MSSQGLDQPTADDLLPRCSWAVGQPMTSYHDQEWGRKINDDAQHLELLVLEGAQAGLSWLTVLRKREGYRETFQGFDLPAVASFGPDQVEAVLSSGQVIAHRGKVESAVANARAMLQIRADSGSFDKWGAERLGPPIVNHWSVPAEVPSTTPQSVELSQELKRVGFRFVGPTTCYSYMQSAGWVVDHLTSCFCHPDHDS